MIKKWQLVFAVLLTATIILTACADPTFAGQDVGQDGHDVSAVDHATYQDSDYDIIKFDRSDALYIREHAVGINGMGISVLVPFLDGDGTPVTEQEYLERGGGLP